jgi:DNA-directed RNA polymerase specialized sigma24 family protein
MKRASEHRMTDDHEYSGDRAPEGPGVVTAAISGAALDAAETYARHVEKASTASNGLSSAVAIDRVRRARAALDRRQVAILDMVAVKGHTIARVAEMTGKPDGDLTALYVAACNALASHYETDG